LIKYRIFNGHSDHNASRRAACRIYGILSNSIAPAVV
jgi:hypothetical protein